MAEESPGAMLKRDLPPTSVGILVLVSALSRYFLASLSSRTLPTIFKIKEYRLLVEISLSLIPSSISCFILFVR